MMYDAVMETLAEMMDRALLPEDGAPGTGGNSEVGKAICRQITSAARAQMERTKQAKDTKLTVRQGAANDNR